MHRSQTTTKRKFKGHSPAQQTEGNTFLQHCKSLYIFFNVVNDEQNGKTVPVSFKVYYYHIRFIYEVILDVKTGG